MAFRLVRLVVGLAAIASAQSPRVGVDPRVELFSIISRLAGYSEYSQGRISAYNEAVDAWFGPWRDHAAVQLAQELRGRDGVAYDAVVNLAVHVTDVETLSERILFDQPGITLDARWHGANARVFLEAARRFVSETRFRDFLASQQPLYDITNARLKEIAEPQLDVTWFDRFFGPRPVIASLIPGLLTGPSSYGPRAVGADGVEEVCAIVGVWSTDAEGRPLFHPGQVSTAVHEFSHSYANTLINLYGAELSPAGERLFEAVRTQMQAQGYGNGWAVLYESLTRAASARYFAERNGPAGGDQSVLYEHSRSFLWTGEFTKLLTQYERSRDSYPTLEAFMPRVVAFLNEASFAPASMPERYEQSRPAVVEVSIPAGSQDVDPNTREIVVRFDRPMMRTHSVLPRIPDRFPRILGTAFDDSAQVCTILVSLDPDRDYELSLNTTGAGWFAGEEGVALRPYLIWFHTRSAPPRVVVRRPSPGRGR